MSEYAPLRDAFHELNRLLIDKQQWDAEHELRKEDMGLKRLQVMSQQQDAELKRKSLMKEAAIAEDQMKVVDANLYDYIPQNKYTDKKLFEDSKTADQFAGLIAGGQGTVNRATGQVLDVNGNPVKMPKALLATRAGQAFGVISSAMDPEEMINENITAAAAKIGEMEAQLNHIPTTDIGKRKELSTRIAEARNVLKEHTKMLEPQNLEPFYRQKMKLLENLTLQISASGGDKDILTALQNSATRVNQDYINVQNRRITQEENEKNRGLERWKVGETKAIEREKMANSLESERIKAEAKKAKAAVEKNQREWAERVDKNGNVIETRPVDIEKRAGSAPTIEEASDGRLQEKDGWRFSKTGEVLQKSLQGKDINISAVGNAIGKAFSSDNVMGIDGVSPADKPRFTAAMMHFDPKHGKGREYKDAMLAVDFVRTAEKMLWEDVDAEVAKQAKILFPSSPDPLKTFKELPNYNEVVNSISAKLANGEDFYQVFRYIPQIEHRASLDPNMVTSTMRPNPEIKR